MKPLITIEELEVSGLGTNKKSYANVLPTESPLFETTQTTVPPVTVQSSSASVIDVTTTRPEGNVALKMREDRTDEGPLLMIVYGIVVTLPATLVTGRRLMNARSTTGINPLVRVKVLSEITGS